MSLVRFKSRISSDSCEVMILLRHIEDQTARGRSINRNGRASLRSALINAVGLSRCFSGTRNLKLGLALYQRMDATSFAVSEHELRLTPSNPEALVRILQPCCASTACMRDSHSSKLPSYRSPLAVRPLDCGMSDSTKPMNVSMLVVGCWMIEVQCLMGERMLLVIWSDVG